MPDNKSKRCGWRRIRVQKGWCRDISTGGKSLVAKVK